jgi:hypothetical protein
MNTGAECIYVAQDKVLWPSLMNTGAECIHVAQDKVRWPSLMNGQSSWLLTQRSGFDSRRYQIF